MKIKTIQAIKKEDFKKPEEDKVVKDNVKEDIKEDLQEDQDDEEEDQEGKLFGTYEDFIGTYQAKVPEDYCAAVRKAFDYYMSTDACYIGDQQFANSCAGRFDYALDLSHMQTKIDGRPERDLNQWIFECLAEYVHVFGHMKDSSYYSTNQKVQMTPKGGGYHVWHDENSTPQSPDSSRIMVWMVYLNENFEGGETEFLYYKKRIKASTGTVLIWPAGLTHAHKGNMVLDGSKYVVTGWFIKAPGAYE